MSLKDGVTYSLIGLVCLQKTSFDDEFFLHNDYRVIWYYHNYAKILEKYWHKFS